MLAGELLKKGAHWTACATVGLFKPSADTSNCFEELLVIEQFLVSLCTLNHDFSLAIH